MRIKQKLVDVPRDMDIVQFLQFDGKPREKDIASTIKDMPLCDFRDAYLTTVGNGSIEANTLYTSKSTWPMSRTGNFALLIQRRRSQAEGP
jgi:hypothetical protein